MKKIKSIIALLLTVAIFSCSSSISVFAAEIPPVEDIEGTEIQPRLGYAYHQTYHVISGGSFAFKPSNILFPSQEWSVKTSNFPAFAEITVWIVDDQFNAICDSVSMKSGTKLENLPLTRNFVPFEQYWLVVSTIGPEGVVNPYLTGNVEFWLY